MKTGKQGIELIKKFEGCKLLAYKCPAGIPTIGYGNTFYLDGKKVKIGDKISQQQAEDLLLNLLPKYEAIVNKKVTRQLKQNQFDALVSHTWNTGGSETLFKMANFNASNEVIKKWWDSHYIMGGGKQLKGLVNRRIEESNLYCL